MEGEAFSRRERQYWEGEAFSGGRLGPLVGGRGLSGRKEEVFSGTENL